MRKLYPLKFETIFKSKVWGGNRIKSILGKDYNPLPNCGETWELSGVNGNLSVVSNGFLAGNDIVELTEVYMGDLIGEKVFAEHGKNFPLLFKFIDANDDLSIQVHPNDEIASKRHQSHGKTEMWYVIHAEPGAEIITGFKRNVTKEEYLDHLENKTLRDILNIESVKKGDVFFIPAGRVHAICSGIVLAEIQQSSDVTYRIYDYNRPDTDGKLRELHTELAIDVIDFKSYPQYKTPYDAKLNQSVELVKCQYFTTNMITFDKKLECEYSFLDSFVVLMCLEGEFSIEWNDGQEIVKCGETILIPAELKSLQYKPLKLSKLLEVYIP